MRARTEAGADGGRRVSQARRRLLLLLVAPLLAVCRKVGARYGWAAVGKIADLPEGALTQVEVTYAVRGRFWDGTKPGRVFLRRNGSALTLFSGRCTHKECLIAYDESSSVFRCPCHGSVYRADGTVLKGPSSRPLDHPPFRIAGGGVLEAKLG